MKDKENKGRVLQSTQIGGYTLLNNEKLGRVLDLVEGVSQPQGEEGAILEKCRSKQLSEDQIILALYDRLGGAVRFGERKIALGTFYDFVAREPKLKVEMAEQDFADEFVLVHKKSAKGKKSETTAERIKRLESKAVKPSSGDEHETPKKRGRPKSK